MWDTARQGGGQVGITVYSEQTVEWKGMPVHLLTANKGLSCVVRPAVLIECSSCIFVIRVALTATFAPDFSCAGC